MSLNGSYSVASINPISFISIPFALMFTVVIIEEVLVGGIIFRIIEEKLGSYLALTISSLLFGVLHLWNPNSTLLSCLFITTSRLFVWCYFHLQLQPMASYCHTFCLEFIQSGIYGAITSGNEKTNSLLTAKIQGLEIIIGGDFGPEGSIQATLLCFIATVILLFLSHKRSKIINPFWK